MQASSEPESKSADQKIPEKDDQASTELTAASVKGETSSQKTPQADFPAARPSTREFISPLIIEDIIEEEEEEEEGDVKVPVSDKKRVESVKDAQLRFIFKIFKMFDI